MNESMSRAAKLSWADPVKRANRLAWWEDKTRVARRNAKISASLLGKSCPWTAERNRQQRGKSASENFKLTHRTSLAQRQQISDTLRGRILTQQHRARIGQGLREHLRMHSSDCPCIKTHGNNNGRSRLGQRMAAVFLADFPEVVLEQPFGKYRVDAYLPPPYHLAFEADGGYWHSLPGREDYDRQRDAYLLEEFGLPVVRLSQQEIDEVAVVVASRRGH